MALLSLAILTIAAGNGFAQEDTELQRCSEINSDNRRLACYDALAAARSPQPPVQQAPSAAPQPPVAAAAAVPEAEPVTAQTSAQAAEPTAEDSLSQREQRRAERQARRDAEAETVSITEVRENLSGLAVFTADDGHVYVQTSSRRARYPEAPFDAQIEAGRFGNSFLLTPAGERTRIPVRRD